MSFSSIAKNEICRKNLGENYCALSELAALIRTTGSISLKGRRNISIDFSTENAAIARRIYSLLKMLYHEPADVESRKTNRLNRGNSYRIKFHGDTKKLLKDSLVIDSDEFNLLNLNNGIPFNLLESDCCKRAYIRGVFLGCGSISDPEKNYHLEFVNNNENHARDFAKLLTYYGLTARIVNRKNYFVNYIKESEQIVDLLNIIGAYNSLLKIENIRVVKGMRNSVNRIINCETANLTKTVDAAVRQLGSIRRIRDTIGLEKLPAPLQELAQTRLDNPEASLKELGQLLNPPVGKSGVNHRLRKIENIAENLSEERSTK
jgi:hypothetical protein